ncbi:hypothetical protein BHM03_00049805, partial [Ensete ventricosum]
MGRCILTLVSYKGSFCDVLQSEKGLPTIPGKSKGDSKDKERKHRKHKDKDREKDKEHKKHKHCLKDRNKDKDREKKKDRSGHHDSGGDHSKKHHEKQNWSRTKVRRIGPYRRTEIWPV